MQHCLKAKHTDRKIKHFIPVKMLYHCQSGVYFIQSMPQINVIKVISEFKASLYLFPSLNDIQLISSGYKYV